MPGRYLQNIELPVAIGKNEDGYDFDAYLLNYAIVVSQDCDLQQDYSNHSIEGIVKHDKFIPSIILIPAYLAEYLKHGEHLKDKNQIMETYNSKNWPIIKNNNNYRYHYLVSDPVLQINELVVDCKHFFTVSRDLFYNAYKVKNHYLASLAPLFRENLTDRFYHYLARIGLPDNANS